MWRWVGKAWQRLRLNIIIYNILRTSIHACIPLIIKLSHPQSSFFADNLSSYIFNDYRLQSSLCYPFCSFRPCLLRLFMFIFLPFLLLKMHYPVAGNHFLYSFMLLLLACDAATPLSVMQIDSHSRELSFSGNFTALILSLRNCLTAETDLQCSHPTQLPSSAEFH